MKKDALFVAIAFFLVLFLNSYFNYSSKIAINEDGKTLADTFYLSGPDPYYNERLLERTLETGKYPYLGGKQGGLDPLLNYPLGGSGGRPPLFNMLTIGLGSMLSLFMNEKNAIGYAMQFAPALYGALLVIPIYFIGKILFNRKVGILAAFIIPLIPIHLGSGHGSAYTLYDHDSFVLLLTTTVFMFLLLSLKEKNEKKSIIYAAMAGVSISAISLTWVAARFVYALVALYAIVQMIVDILTSRIETKIVKTSLTALVVGYILTFPLYWIKYGLSPNVPFFFIVGVAIFSAFYLWLGKKNIPWLISLPSLFVIAAITIVFLYLIKDTTNPYFYPLRHVSEILFKGVYGSKVALTIAEASTFEFSRTVMSFGPVIYWLGWIGFIFLLYNFYKKKWPRPYLLIIVWFLVEIWLASSAGRFLNDLVPLTAFLGAWSLWIFIDKLDFRGMIKSIKGIGRGLYGIKKVIKVRHILGAFFIAFFIILPNGWLAMDASLPFEMKREFENKKLGAFGLTLHTEKYWTDALMWLREQNENLSEEERPAFISWWDYGFYCAAIGKNPTVADNFQEGIPTAANFHTSESEKEAVCIFIVRIAEGDMKRNNGEISIKVASLFEKYVGKNATKLVNIIEKPEKYAPSCGKIVGEEYGAKRFKIRPENARYRDAVAILMNLDDENVTMLYRELQNATGYSIRYYGVEGYDINIFNVFTFLADKGMYGYELLEDDYFKLWYKAEKTGQKFTPDEVENIYETMTSNEIEKLYGKFEPYLERKDKFYNSMVYKVYLGNVPKQIFENLSTKGIIPFWTDNPTDPFGEGNYFYNPTAYLKHFVIKYLSPLTLNKSLYFGRASLCIGMPAVVIAKYYEGCRITGVVKSGGEPLDDIRVVVHDDFKQTIETKLGDNRIIRRTIEKIPHDYNITIDGKFSVIAPAGNITLAFYVGDVLIKEITFNKTGVFAPISEEEATRIKPWKRDIGVINIEKGGVKGIIFWDKDGDGKYTEGIDTPLKAKITIAGKKIWSRSNGKYEIRNLLPRGYTITVEKSGYSTKRIKVIVKPKEIIWQNISLYLAPVKLSGNVWYDENKNGKMDENESMASIPVKFIVTKALDKKARNRTIRTDENGSYSISLYPSSYKVVVNYTESIGNTTYRYIYEGRINIRIGDKDKILNIKLARISEQQ